MTRDRLAVLVERVEPERVGVLAAELEDVADLDAAARSRAADRSRAQRSPSRISAAPILPSGVKSRPRDDVGGVLAGLVGAGDPRAALDDERVDQVADLPRRSPQHCGPM